LLGASVASLVGDAVGGSKRIVAPCFDPKSCHQAHEETASQNIRWQGDQMTR
jgi:hypothetical protein